MTAKPKPITPALFPAMTFFSVVPWVITQMMAFGYREAWQSQGSPLLAFWVFFAIRSKPGQDLWRISERIFGGLEKCSDLPRYLTVDAKSGFPRDEVECLRDPGDSPGETKRAASDISSVADIRGLEGGAEEKTTAENPG